jgi:hypothetical protein
MSARALNSRSVIFTMRMPLEHREKLIEAAKRDRRSLAGFLIDSALGAADRKVEAARKAA